MRLARIRLKNFRCYREKFAVDFEEITAFIGKNDSGKSSVLDALAIFFDEAKPDSDDGCISGDKTDVRIICEFDELPSSLIVDRDYATTLEDEHMLNADGRLEVQKVFDATKATIKPVVFIHAHHPHAGNRGDLLSLNNTDLKARAQQLGVGLSDVDQRVNAQIRRAIWDSADSLELGPTEIQLDKPGSKQIWEQLKKELPVFAIFKSDRKSTDQDDEAQSPLKSAVDEAIKAQETELQAIADRVRDEVLGVAQKTVEKIKEMDPTLADELNPRFGKYNWSKVFSISLTGDDDVPLNKRGSGVRRLVLLNFFRAKAEQRVTKAGGPGVIYAIEELETSQHPHNQRLLLDAFSELAAQSNCQVILTTHTPMLARLLPISALRYIEVRHDSSRTVHCGEDTAERVAKDLGVLADHDVKLFVGVEGKHDENFLKIISRILNESGEDLPNLEALSDEGEIIFFILGGSNLALWTSQRLRPLNRPEFHLFDRDEGEKQRQHERAAAKVNAQPHCKAVLTAKREMENYLHPEAIREASSAVLNCEVNVTFGDDDDVPMLVAQIVHEAAQDSKPWDEVDEKKRKNKEDRAKAWLNTAAVEKMTTERLTESDPDGDVRAWLSEIAEMLSRST